MQKSLLGLVFALIASPALAADPPATADSDCIKYACRPGRALDLRTRENGPIHVRFGATPYVKDGAVMILPGETLVFRFPASDAPSGEPVFVREESFTRGQPTGPDVKFPVPENDPNGVVLRQAFGDVQANGTADKRLANEPPGTFFVAYRQMPDGTGMYLNHGAKFLPTTQA
jgi:hypothetical protein